ncbi:SET domain-containing protein SmydA-8-like [Thrips palmi]|uniref:SET domain-containing protein SmydA-8-like n=1 Tax=Thrips palmi TaxID=161013 RepID=A0A6P8Z6H5_THRPL|nr:SET domain-containing protein SmydA-8-like [Thrips palmi]
MSAVVCVVCAAPAPLKCSACQGSAYCSREHQKQHWKTHKVSCRPFEVRSSADLGRHLVATRDVAVDAVLLTEAPLAVGPRHHDNPRGPCVGCLQALPAVPTESQAMCPGCLWPCCSTECPGLGDALHHGAECRVLQAGRHVVLQSDLRYDALLPLRCLLLQKTSPSRWRILQAMDSHSKDRGPGTPVYRETQNRVVSYLRDNFLRPLSVIVSGSRASADSVEGLLEDCSEATIHRIVSVLDVNALEIGSGGVELSALYPTAYLMEHSCVPNTRHTFGSASSAEQRSDRASLDADFKITLRAGVAIKKDDHISTMYTHILWGTMARREHLLAVKGFHCRCRRCGDPRELGSMLSALRCLSCGSRGDVADDAFLLPTDPLADSADWRCAGCGAPLAAEHVVQVVASLDEQVGRALEGTGDARMLEDVANKLDKLLHPHHYHCLQVKHSLLQVYGSQPGLEMDRLSEQQLQRKAALCREVMGVLLQLDPMLCRLQLYASVCLLELQRADLEALKRSLALPATSAAAVAAGVQDMRSLLQRAVHALRFEADSRTASDGARMALAVHRARQDLDVWARVHKVAVPPGGQHGGNDETRRCTVGSANNLFLNFQQRLKC